MSYLHRWLPAPGPEATGILRSAERRRTTVDEKITVQHWMILAFLFYLDVAVLGCLFLIAMNKIYLLP
jgi:hypothetical protein